ncbi:hypothetical protein Ccrd_023057 [Cynara cardunculus var. scolymus]|uniref:Uncharacterized protein n=1 Tax=Cynara cardunculus var. scolymus TaxID=59895 RepID=A0A103XXK6_CYNCS|nr:hypothetical protein Ccrd_023057 [Cynara cardunculus var. scolymus]
MKGRLKSPWSRRKRKHALTPQQWKSLFTPEGKLRDGVKFLKKVHSETFKHGNTHNTKGTYQTCGLKECNEQLSPEQLIELCSHFKQQTSKI